MSDITGQPSLEDIANYLDSLPPEEQQAALASLQLQGANAVPYTFGGDFQAELSPQAFEGAGYTGGYNLPNFTTKGALDPRDQAQMAQSTTFAKNREGLLADNVFSMQAGPGAYAAGAFEPTTTYKGKVVDFPGQRKLQALAQTGGWQGAVAQRILAGKSSSQALGEIRKLMQTAPDDPTLDDETRALQADIFQSLNARSSGSGGDDRDAADQVILTGEPGATTKKTAPGPDIDWTQFDLQGMQSWADERQMDLLSDQPRDQLFQGPDGKYYDTPPEETPSAQAKWFADRGYTTPDKSYADQAYQEEVLNRQNPNRPAEIQQEQDASVYGQVAQAGLSNQASLLDRMASAFEQEMLTQQQGREAFIPRQQAQNAPLAPAQAAPATPQRGGSAQGGTRKGAGSYPPDPNQATPLIPPLSREQLEAQLAEGMGGMPEYSSGVAPSTIPRNVEGEPIQPGPGKDWTGAPLPSEQDLANYYNKTFPVSPLQVNQQTGDTAPVFDFGAGQAGNAGMSTLLSALAAKSGQTKPREFTAPGGGKATIVPGGRVMQPNQQGTSAIRQAASQARTASNNQYNNNWQRMYQGPSDFADTFTQRLSMNNMAAQGRTPLNDEIMQRRLLINALGLYQ